MGALLAILATAVACAVRPMRSDAAVTDAAVTVSLRVEGAEQTLYDGPVSVAPSAVDGNDGSGAHPCQGDLPSAPQATPAGALSSAKLDWQGSWFPEFQDFFVNRIGPDASRPPFAYWALLVNWRYAQGACQAALHEGDEALWAYDTAERPLILRLSGPAHVAVGIPFTVRVRDGWIRADGADGGPVAGALIGGSATAGDGQAHIQIEHAGVLQLRATRAGAIASNALEVCVGDATCRVPAGAPDPAAGTTSPTGAGVQTLNSPTKPHRQPRKGASHAQKTHRNTRRCLGTRRAHGKHSRGPRRSGHRKRARGGSHIHAAGPHDRHHHQHAHTRSRKLLGHECRRRIAARH